ncbi:Uncharacterized protein APZ42_032051 [Daphnia magna]|uniref:Secreted protein n=1 Tax=Daphnia magna TaxID=35525 RepID=A0A164MBV2_9CRUS|nr:Uncharacterized protein APZ42_032051 [Daphnia magna]
MGMANWLMPITLLPTRAAVNDVARCSRDGDGVEAVAGGAGRRTKRTAKREILDPSHIVQRCAVVLVAAQQKTPSPPHPQAFLLRLLLHHDEDANHTILPLWLMSH